MLTRTRLLLIIVALVGTSVLTVFQYARDPSAFDVLGHFTPLSEYSPSYHSALNVFSAIYVVSIPRRTDRRQDMERLRNTLHVEWTYLNATDSDSSEIARILDRVRAHRARERHRFSWPTDIDALSLSNDRVPRAGADFWDELSELDADDDLEKGSWAHENPLTCAEHDDTIPPYTANLPIRSILNTRKIACWHSHLQAVYSIASQTPENGHERPSLILEDDVDMEVDIEERLAYIWDGLPERWDMLFLGHCWSDETHNEAVWPISFHNTSSPDEHNGAEKRPVALHPSYKPKCSHAYALTPTGARRLWLHLRHPQFAYSRALDQAFAWLIESGRLKSFSIVPAPVIQRKVSVSDVMEGVGSSWRETLKNGVFG